MKHTQFGPNDPNSAIETKFAKDVVGGFIERPAFLTSSTANIAIIGNTPTTGGKLSEQNWQDWLKSIPDPVEPAGACACIGPEPGQTECPCALRRRIT